MSEAYADRVRSWAALLRSGSTRRWSEMDWSETGESVGGSGVLPSAAQLEVVRRLPRGLPDFERLADLVLATPGAGRGLVDPPVPDAEGPAFGSPATAPEDLPAEELLRVCAPVLVALLGMIEPAAALPVRRGWRPRRRQFVVLGAPATAEAVREALRARGLREGGRRATYLVVGGPLDELMAQRWSARVRAGSATRWSRMWRTAESGDRVPPGIDLPGLAGRLARQFGADRVHVMLGEDAAAVGERVARLLGLSSLQVESHPDPLATDLLRRLNPLLVMAVGEERRRVLVDRLWPLLAGEEGSGRPPVPRDRRAWAVAAGTRMAERLRAADQSGDYAVHGDPAGVVPPEAGGHRGVLKPAAVLDFALDVVGRAWIMAEEGSHS